MKLTLRKANAVQSTINEAIKALDLNTSVPLNEFEDVQEQINTVRDRFFTNHETRLKLVGTLYEIRAKVAAANANVGISNMLADVAMLEKQISYYNQLASKGARTALRVLNGQVNKLKEVKEDGYGYNRRDVVTSIFDGDEIESFRRLAADFKRQKQSLQDSLLELNVQTTIELKGETATFLEKADIL
jgi:hypothetical protein